jgi:hypothetical protein
MKRILAILVMLGLFSAAIAGCHADAGIDVASSATAAH